MTSPHFRVLARLCSLCGLPVERGEGMSLVHSDRQFHDHNAVPAPQKAAHDLAGAGALSSRDDGLPSEASDTSLSTPPSRRPGSLAAG